METNAAPPPHPSLLPVPSDIVDQKQIVLHVTLRDQNVLFMFHLQTDAGWGSRHHSAGFISSLLKVLKTSQSAGTGSFEIYVAL